MTGEELKKALLSCVPVEHKGIEYKCVSAIIYRSKDGKIDVSAELQDKNARSVSIVDPRNVKELSE